jgi:hypothetical protein
MMRIALCSSLVLTSQKFMVVYGKSFGVTETFLAWQVFGRVDSTD